MKTRICPFRDASFPFMCLNSRMHIRKNFWQVLLLAAFGQSSRKRHREAVALCNRALEAGVSIGLFITNMNKQLKKSNARMNLPAFFSSTR